MDVADQRDAVSLHREVDPHLVDLELARLRRVAPVSWQAGLRSGSWAVTKHADVSAALRATDLFSSEHGTAEPLYVGSDPAAGSMLAVTDPPLHTELRRVVRSALDRRLTDELPGHVRRTVKRLLAHTLAGEVDDVVVDVAHRLPVETLAHVLAVPEADRHRLARLSSVAFLDDASVGRGMRPERTVRAEANMEIIEYFVALARARGRASGDDFVSMLVSGGLTDRQAGLNCFNVLASGIGTTRSAVVGFLRMLAENTELLPVLRGRPAIMDLAVEEAVRWISPVRQVLRVCTKDTVFRGQEMLAGQPLSLWIVSANRDEDVFEDPASVRLDRSPNPHLGFGIGDHACVGMRIARLELRELTRELLRLSCDVVLDEHTGTPQGVRLERHRDE